MSEQICPCCNGVGKSEANGYTLSCTFCKGKGKTTVADLKKELAELKLVYENKLMKGIKDAEESVGPCLVDVLISAIAELSARLHQLEVKVFWIKGK